MMRFLLLISVVTWHVASATTAMETDEGRALALEAVTKSTNEFSSNFFKTISADVKGNLICSPLSASMVLSMAAYGARGNTEKQMRSVLVLPENDELAKTGYQTFIDSFSNYKQVDLRLANKMFLGKNFVPKPEFKELTKTSFRSEAENVDFSNSAVAVKTINDWCAAQTNNRIKDLFKPADVDGLTALVLVNAVYFKGNWAEKFDPAQTKPLPFHVDGTTVKDVPTMYRSGSYRYGELPEVNARFVQLPYKSENITDSVSMFIVLPNAIDGLSDLVKDIEKVTMEKLLAGWKRDVNLYLPKFKIESEIPLNEPLARMGMSEMFTDSANFTGILEGPPLKVSKVIQKAFIEVNEEGSEAAAATALQMVGYAAISPQPTITMKVDHPFFFSIIAQSTGMRLFQGFYSS